MAHPSAGLCERSAYSAPHSLSLSTHMPTWGMDVNRMQRHLENLPQGSGFPYRYCFAVLQTPWRLSACEQRQQILYPTVVPFRLEVITGRNTGVTAIQSTSMTGTRPA